MKKSSQFPIPKKIRHYEKEGTMAERCNWEKVVDDRIRFLKRALRKNGNDTVMDMSDAMVKRRRRAVVSTIEDIIERYKDFPGLEYEHRDDTGKMLIDMQFPPVLTYNQIEEHAYFLCAAAIWILDEVMADESKQPALFRLLPRTERELDDVGLMPEIWHPYYDDELIMSVMYVLYHRDMDDGKIEMDDEKTERIITNSKNAGGEKSAGPHRRAFDALMALIPRESVERAVKLYEDLFHEWLDRFFLCAAPLWRASRREVDRYNKLADEYNAAREEMIGAIDEITRNPALTAQRAKPAFNPLLADPFRGMADPLRGGNKGVFPQVPAGGMIQPIDKLTRAAERMNNINDRCNETLDALSEAEKLINRFRYEVSSLGYLPQDVCRDHFGDEAAEHMLPLKVARPFEVCFALIWLIDYGSDLPWLYGCGCALMEEVSESLPWGICEYEELYDPVWEKDGEEGEQLSFLKGAPRGKTGGSTATPDWFDRKYLSDTEDSEHRFFRSLSQVLYEETGCLVPRDMRLYDERRKDIREYGVPPRETAMLLQISTVLSNAKRRYPAMNLMKGWGETDGAGADGAGNTGLNYEELAGKLKEAQEENKKLRSALHESEKTCREARKELGDIRRSAEMDHRELADLRDVIFSYESLDKGDEEISAADETAFPYEVKKDTVVFGGHETWLKTIRQMLTGNIRFIDKDINFSVNIIRGAETVWIQPNALSHSLYYRIVDAARRYKKTVRYFTYASAARGAMQVMKADGWAGE